MNAENPYDVLILGGGITGISLGRVLAETGKSCLLVERGDFASGTSQASGMMIWGGLLYLKNFEFRQVRRLCRARDQLMASLPEEVAPRRFAYMRSRESGRNPLFVRAALSVYQMLAGGKRRAVCGFPRDHVGPDLDARLFKSGWSYEEGFLRESDARFSLRRLLSAGLPLDARNYCEISAIRETDGVYNISLPAGETVRARKIVNCCGVWADEVNAKFGIATRHTHHLSKGVYLLLPRSENTNALVVDMGENDDTLCWVPWGDVVMWGPTETTISDLGHAHATADDVNFLLTRLNHYSPRQWTRDDIVNIRCGVRPLVCPRGKTVAHPMQLSRKAVIEKASGQNWWTVFGGKLSGAADLAERIHHTIYGTRAKRSVPVERMPPRRMTTLFFNGRELPDPGHCREHEHCRSLEDYLRRRTNLAQWIGNAGFGGNFEYEHDLLAIAAVFHDDPVSALANYKRRVVEERSRWYD
ncbi:MAG: FAD-dependent oxidoreductase [Verrucomicrobiota bacterium]